MSDKIPIQTLKTLPIIKVAERLGIPLNRSKMTHCFLHDDKTASLSIYVKKNMWKCFGCGEGGDVINLVEKFSNVPFKQACAWLSSEFGIKTSYSSFDRSIFETAKKHYREMLKTTEEVADNKCDSELYQWVVDNNKLSVAGKDYLLKRGFSEEIITTFKLVDISNPDAFFQKAKEKWGTTRLLNSGLAKESRGFISLIWWKHVIIIPYINENNQVVYLQGRSLDPSNTKYKYINLKGVSPEIFNGVILANALPESLIVICEGAMDAMMAVKNKKQAVGIPGSNSFKPEWAARFSRFQIAVVPDNDEGGKIFWKKVSKAFYFIGMNPQRISLPIDSKDLTDYLTKKQPHDKGNY